MNGIQTKEVWRYRKEQFEHDCVSFCGMKWRKNREEEEEREKKFLDPRKNYNSIQALFK